MEVIVVLVLGIMVIIPVGIGLSYIERSYSANKFICVLVMSMFGLCGLVGLSFFGLTRDNTKKEIKKPKYELIQEEVYRKIK